MAKKRTTLIKDFIECGNFEELKAVFDKCNINTKRRHRHLFYEANFSLDLNKTPSC